MQQGGATVAYESFLVEEELVLTVGCRRESLAGSSGNDRDRGMHKSPGDLQLQHSACSQGSGDGSTTLKR